MIRSRLAASHAILAAMVAEFLMGTSGLANLFHAAKDELNMERAGASAIATSRDGFSRFSRMLTGHPHRCSPEPAPILTRPSKGSSEEGEPRRRFAHGSEIRHP